MDEIVIIFNILIDTPRGKYQYIIPNVQSAVALATIVFVFSFYLYLNLVLPSAISMNTCMHWQ